MMNLEDACPYDRGQQSGVISLPVLRSAGFNPPGNSPL
jgi:hypothetical protein